MQGEITSPFLTLMASNLSGNYSKYEKVIKKGVKKTPCFSHEDFAHQDYTIFL
jgi:hypothetical protein